jgi:hypothetical protein
MANFRIQPLNCGTGIHHGVFIPAGAACQDQPPLTSHRFSVFWPEGSLGVEGGREGRQNKGKRGRERGHMCMFRVLILRCGPSNVPPHNRKYTVTYKELSNLFPLTLNSQNTIENSLSDITGK